MIVVQKDEKRYFMPTICIPSPLRYYTDGLAEVQTQGNTVNEALQDFVIQYPDINKYLFKAGGELRPYINLFLNNENIRHLQGMKTELKSEDRLLIVPSIAGGGQSVVRR
jgi:molybdopterin converting factor small subunit